MISRRAFIKTTSTAAGAAMLGNDIPSLAAEAAKDSAARAMLKHHRRLFVDDFHVQAIEGLSRNMHPVTKHANNPILRPERPWEGEAIAMHNAVFYDADAGLFRMWYANYHGPERPYVCYATSTDGLNWDRPNLGLRQFDGTMANNMLPLGSATQFVHEPDAEPRQKYKSVMWNHELGQHAMYSEDGLSWNFQRRTPLSGVGDVFVAVNGRDPISAMPPARAPRMPLADDFPPRYVGAVRLVRPVGRFDGSTKTRPARRVLAITTSTNWVDWTQPARILTPDDQDDQMAQERIEAAIADGVLPHDHAEDRRCEFYTMFVFPYEDLFLGMMIVFDPCYEFNRIGGRNQDGPGHFQLAASRNLRDWQRLGRRQPFIPRGAAGQFDCGLAWYAGLPIVVGDQLWIYYTGATITHGSSRNEEYMAKMRVKIAAGDWPPQTSIGLATLRRDGFVSLDAGARPGSLTTRPFVWSDGGLYVNVDASRGSLAAEVIGADGKVIPGFEQSRCRPVETDAPGEAIQWTGRNTDRLAGRTVQLRFVLWQAELYSYWLA